jgi:hypothetical protein
VLLGLPLVAAAKVYADRTQSRARKRQQLAGAGNAISRSSAGAAASWDDDEGRQGTGRGLGLGGGAKAKSRRGVDRIGSVDVESMTAGRGGSRGSDGDATMPTTTANPIALGLTAATRGQSRPGVAFKRSTRLGAALSGDAVQDAV